MLQTLKSVILDFQEGELDTGVPRHLALKTVPNKATVCIGVRRCGKSTFMYQVIEKLLENGVSKENLLFINFFDDRLHRLQDDKLGLISEAYFSIYPHKKNNETVYCFFDEIQYAAGWESFVDRMMRTEKCEIYLTGSSSQMLSREIFTQMRGRSLSWELFPFSFREFLDYQKISVGDSLSTKKRLLVQKAFEEYWESGGFPEVAGVDRRMRIKIHQEYFNTILFRDLVDRHDISHPNAVVDLAHRLINSVGSLYSINSLTGYLKSLGHKVPKASVSDYVKWMEDAYFLFSLYVYDNSITRRNANPKKIYCIDHSLVRSVNSGITVDSGHLLESLVFVALRRLHSQIYYYKTKNGREVDFVVIERDKKKSLIQVCETMQDEKTRKRELDAIGEAMDELELSKATIVTRSESDNLTTETGEIEVVPIWRFLLDH